MTGLPHRQLRRDWTRPSHYDLTGANCTNDRDHEWTYDRKPPTKIFIELATICQTCPVQAACAATALADDLTAGVYAGTWVPHHRQRGAWMRARDELHRRTWGLIA